LKRQQAGGYSWKRHAFSVGRITGLKRRVLELSFCFFFVENRRAVRVTEKINHSKFEI